MLQIVKVSLKESLTTERRCRLSVITAGSSLHYSLSSSNYDEYWGAIASVMAAGSSNADKFVSTSPKRL